MVVVQKLYQLERRRFLHFMILAICILPLTLCNSEQTMPFNFFSKNLPFVSERSSSLEITDFRIEITIFFLAFHVLD